MAQALERRPRAGDRRAVRRRGHRRRVDRRDARHRAPAARSPSRAGAPGLQRGQRELQPPVPRGVGALSRSAFVALLDGDDFWTAPTKLGRQVALLRERPACSICFPRRRRRPRRPRPAELAQQRPAVGPAAGHRRPVGQEPHPRLLPPCSGARSCRGCPGGTTTPRGATGRCTCCAPTAGRSPTSTRSWACTACTPAGCGRGRARCSGWCRRRRSSRTWRDGCRVTPPPSPLTSPGGAARSPSSAVRPRGAPRSCAGGSPPGRRRASCASDSTPSSRATRSPGRASSASSASPGAA